MCGLLLINKPSGITSFGAVNKIRRLTGEKHIGHTGTLDPMASGVLPVLVGSATKLSDFLICSDKSYVATVRLGTLTDTLDITGKVVKTRPVNVTNEQIDRALLNLLGETEQIPPMFSAIKKDGKRLYSIARKGGTAEIPARKITVYSIKRTSDIDENFEFSLSCNVSKGTYIRALARDIGEYLGTGGVLTSLQRTKTLGFSLSDCVPLDILTEQNINDYILPASRAVDGFREVYLTSRQAFRFSNGGGLSFDRLPVSDFKEGEFVRVNYNGTFLGVAVADNNIGELKYKCLINPVGKGK